VSETINTPWGPLTVDEYPPSCPLCHKSIIPIQTDAMSCVQISGKAEYRIVFSCPNNQCLELFIASYVIAKNIDKDDDDDAPPARVKPFFFSESKPSNFIHKEFNDEIVDYSSSFVEIYKECEDAESAGLMNVCGVGYRKALEFLIKDYLIKQNPALESEIKSEQLGRCIGKYVSDNRIKEVARRAVWLGNDETHYERRWRDMDLQNLKQLIHLTVFWIEMETLTATTLSSMP
jgi:hypothetical protein